MRRDRSPPLAPRRTLFGRCRTRRCERAPPRTPRRRRHRARTARPTPAFRRYAACSRRHHLIERLEQFAQSHADAAFDRSERFLEPVGDLAIAEPAEIRVLDRYSLIRWERGYRRCERGRAHALENLFVERAFGRQVERNHRLARPN